ncbi:SCO family protein [Algiphilus sp. W345]|uniref:SCO family protein n=1 Tax=Banduia mediterranea TaxID=3075609 RepID=A0ABU2WPV8_9GAMM|nr:SCO family protein [Algiphilus sp. W345]MDT0499254.1 SCO family protein [Algiphilus sp. W345]
MTPRSPFVLASFVAVFIGVWIFVLASTHNRQDFQIATVLDTPRTMPEFELIDEDGAAFTRDRLLGQWTLLFAGFTHCADVCPSTLALLGNVKSRLAQSHPGASFQTVFLSVDPARDQPAALAKYVRYFDPEFVGVTGAKTQVDRVCSSLGLYYAKSPGPTDDSYTMDHTAAIVVIDPQARARAYFVVPKNPQAMASDLAFLMSV